MVSLSAPAPSRLACGKDRAADNESGTHSARLAQSVEHGTLNPRVVGSSPTSGEHFYKYFFQLLKTFFPFN